MNDNNKLISTGQTAGIVAEAPKSKNRTKNPIQLSWENIHITAHPPTGRCKPKNALKEPKEIIRGVSGTVLPGQFLAIIGASGKFTLTCGRRQGRVRKNQANRKFVLFRCWKNHPVELLV